MKAILSMNRDFLIGERGRPGCTDWRLADRNRLDAPLRMFGETPTNAGGTPALPIPLSGSPARAALKFLGRLIVILSNLAFLVIPSEAAEIVGITEPFHDVTMSSPVNGVIGARLVEEGAFVKKGQTLIELDKRLEELEVSRRKLAKEMSQTELDRLKTLSEKNAISVSREELGKKQTEFNIASVDLDLAQEQLRKRMLVSPIDGYVTEIFLEVGEGCELRQPIVRVVETRRCYFVTNLDAKLGHALAPGKKLRLSLDAGKSPVEAEGTVSLVSPVIDPSSGLMKVKLTFDNPDGQVRPGAAGRLLIAD